MSVSSCHPKTNKPLDTSLRLLQCFPSATLHSESPSSHRLVYELSMTSHSINIKKDRGCSLIYCEFKCGPGLLSSSQSPNLTPALISWPLVVSQQVKFFSAVKSFNGKTDSPPAKNVITKKIEAPLMEEIEIYLLEAIFKTPKMSKLHFFRVVLTKAFLSKQI